MLYKVIKSSIVNTKMLVKRVQHVLNNQIYLKFGADATLRAKHARFVTPYDNKKNILTTGATTLNLPVNNISCWKENM